MNTGNHILLNNTNIDQQRDKVCRIIFFQILSCTKKI